jgi:hypothetical protein
MLLSATEDWAGKIWCDAHACAAICSAHVALRDVVRLSETSLRMTSEADATIDRIIAKRKQNLFRTQPAGSRACTSSTN